MTYNGKKYKEVEDEFTIMDDMECKSILRNIDNMMDKKGPELRVMLAYHIIELLVNRFDEEDERKAIIETLKKNIK